MCTSLKAGDAVEVKGWRQADASPPSHVRSEASCGPALTLVRDRGPRVPPRARLVALLSMSCSIPDREFNGIESLASQPPPVRTAPRDFPKPRIIAERGSATSPASSGRP